MSIRCGNTMNRRHFLGAAAALPFSGPLLAQAGSPLTAAAREAWLYGLPLIENAGSRQEFFDGGFRFNGVRHLRGLTTPESQSVTTPNNDTLYSRSWINLANGPVRVTLPAMGDRYCSVAFMDMFTNNFAVLGTRTTGSDGGSFTLVGPGAATTDPLAIRSPTPWVWMLVRVLVDGAADLPAATRAQNGFTVAGLSTPAQPRRFATRAAPWAAYFNSVQALLLENPPPATDDRLFDRVAPLGLGPRGGFNARHFSAAQAREIEAGAAEAKALLRSSRRQGRVVESWAYPKANLGDFGQDYFYRAQVAVGGLAALPNAEAMYMRPVNSSGGVAFDSATSWVLRLPADRLPPVDAFWSLTMYHITLEGQFFFFNNPIDRYAIGDRTAGLKRHATGGIDIWMTRRDPGPERRANWLPTPPEGSFGVVFRAYLPGPALLDGEYRLPPLERLD